jgi:TPR repeat protein
VYTFCHSEQKGKCPFCNADQSGKTDEENVEDIMKRAEANDPVSMSTLARKYYNGAVGVQQDRTKAIELFTRSAELGYSDAHYNLGVYYYEGGDKKKAKFHNEAAAMAGHEVARNWLACFEFQSGNIERAIKHWTIAASSGHYSAMFNLQVEFMKGAVTRESIDSSLTSYNNSCAEMRSETRDATIRAYINHN